MIKNFTFLLCLLCTLVNTTALNAQVSGDYRSAVVTGNWSDITSWQTFDGTSWVAATVYPQYNVGNDVTILNGNNITVDIAAGASNQLYIKQTTVSNGGIITITSGETLWVFDGTGTDLTVNGNIINNGNFKLNSGSPTISFGTTGYYQHNINGTQIPNSSWATGSVCEITGVTSTVPSGITTQVTPFSNLTWNCPNQSTNLSMITAIGNYTLTNGNFTVANTKFGSSIKLRLFGTGATTASSVSIGGNLIINSSAAQLILYASSTSATSFSVNVAGDVQLSAGSLGLSDNSGTGSTLNVSGNFLYSGGALSASSTGKGTINVTNSFNVSTFGTVAVTSANNINLNATTGSANFAPGTFLSISSSASTFNFNGRPVVFQSDATGTAGIGSVSGAITNATNVTVQRYIPSSSRKKYTLVSSPVSGTTINAAWQEGTGTSSTFATATGFGTQITGAVAQGTNGFDGPSTSTTSIFTYNDANISGAKWTALSSTTTASSIAPGTGYLLFVRGDRSENRATTGNSNNTILRATGTLTTGSVNFKTTGGTTGTPALLATSGTYNLIANPYACAIDWLAAGTAKTNIGGSFYVYDPNTGTFITCDGTTVSPVTTPATQQSPRYIQSGQAFFIVSTSTTPALTIAESSKVTSVSGASNTTVFGDDLPKPQLNLNIYRAVGNVFADGVVALFDKGYSTKVSMDEDAAKFANFNESFSLRRSGLALSIEKRPLLATSDTLFFSLSNFGKRDYNLVIDGSNFTEATATLEDRYTATKQAIDLSGTTTYKFTVNADAASSSNDRFIITLGSAAKQTAIDATANNSLFVKLSPNPVANQLQVSFKTAAANQTTINIVNSLGQVVKTVNAGNVDNGNINIPVKNLSTGIYTVQLLSGYKQISSQKLVKE